VRIKKKLGHEGKKESSRATKNSNIAQESYASTTRSSGVCNYITRNRLGVTSRCTNQQGCPGRAVGRVQAVLSDSTLFSCASDPKKECER